MGPNWTNVLYKVRNNTYSSLLTNMTVTTFFSHLCLKTLDEVSLHWGSFASNGTWELPLSVRTERVIFEMHSERLTIKYGSYQELKDINQGRLMYLIMKAHYTPIRSILRKDYKSWEGLNIFPSKQRSRWAGYHWFSRSIWVWFTRSSFLSITNFIQYQFSY